MTTTKNNKWTNLQFQSGTTVITNGVILLRVSLDSDFVEAEGLKDADVDGLKSSCAKLIGDMLNEQEEWIPAFAGMTDQKAGMTE